MYQHGRSAVHSTALSRIVSLCRRYALALAHNSLAFQCVREGRFVATETSEPSAEEVERGRDALRELGPKIFGETEAGSWVLGLP